MPITQNGNFQNQAHITAYGCEFSYEASDLFLLSRVGEQPDKRHMHRIHAMAMSIGGRSVLAIQPMGGGKSTLCSALLKYPEHRPLSDGSPFISSDGRVHAFPLRPGLLPGSEIDVPKEHQRTIQRMEFGQKILIGYEYFASRVEPSADPGVVFIGKRSLAEVCTIEPTGGWEQFKAIAVNCVVGPGLYQGLEWTLTHSPVELWSRTGVARSGLKVAKRLFAKSQVYHLTLGRNQQLNAETIRAFVADKLGSAEPNRPRNEP